MKLVNWTNPKSSIVLLAMVLVAGLTACQPGNVNERTNGAPDKSENSAAPKATIEDVETGIRDHIKEKTAEGQGFFHFKSDSSDFNLKLVRVHTEYLSVLGPSEFFACVDLADVKGDVYDVDFFLKGKPGDMAVTRTKMHKLNGKPYYTWKQNKTDKTWFTVPVEDADNRLLGVIEQADAFEFRYQTKIPELKAPAKMWLPIAQDDPFQHITIQSIEAPVAHQLLEEKQFGNKVLYLELQPAHSGQTVVVNYGVQRQEKGPYQDDTDPTQYLGSSELLPIGGRFFDIASKVIEQKEADTKLMQARALYDYIIDDMRYAKQGKYGTGDANFACDSRSGNCTEFHSFFISLARSAGIPARFAIGAAIPSERNEGGVNGYHCWAEFYAEDKWWPVDISEANKYTALATYYFGHHPANRIEFSRGRDLVIEPGPQSGPIKFLAYPILETAGSDQVLKTTFTFVRKEG